MRSPSRRARARKAKRNERVNSKANDEKLGANASVVCHHGGRKGHNTRDCWYAGNAEKKGNDNKKVSAIAQPTAEQMKEIKDAMGRLELAAGMSDSGTIV